MRRRVSQLGWKHQGHGHEKVGVVRDCFHLKEHRQSISVRQYSVAIKNDGNGEATWKTFMT